VKEEGREKTSRRMQLVEKKLANINVPANINVQRWQGEKRRRIYIYI
jgi:hypothetical protein